jgi:hypothetical protein
MDRIGESNADDLIFKKNSRRINTHHHIIPEFYAKAVEETGGDPSGWTTPAWSVEQAKEHMSMLGVETAIVSITTPGTKIYEDNKEKGRILARKLNQLKTVVFIHPSEEPTSMVNRYLPQPLIDYSEETTRTARVLF